jgi:hypothetical protein
MKKLTEICKTIFGYGIMVTLFAGGLTFFAYLVALIVGGDTAALICEITYKQVTPIIVKVSTVMILLGLVCMYMSGEKSLTPSEKKKKITDKK